MAALTLTNTLPQGAELVILSESVLERIDQLSHQAIAVVIATPDQQKDADSLYKELRSLEKEITAGRLALTKPLDEFKAKAIEAERSGTAALTTAAGVLASRIDAYIKAENVRREAERQRALREAEAERVRLQKEADERADAQRSKLQEEAELNAPPGEVPEEIPVTACLPVAVKAPVAYFDAPLKSAAIKKKTTWELVITDAAKVPVELNGAELRPIDPAACLRVLATGMKIPGCERREVNGLAQKG